MNSVEGLLRGCNDPYDVVALLQASGYQTSPLEYPEAELGIPNYLDKHIRCWWLLSDYREGTLPFQVHLIEVNWLHWWLVGPLSRWFQRHHPGYYLFIYTEDYSRFVLATVETTLERQPPRRVKKQPFVRRDPNDKPWPLLPKYYVYWLILEPSLTRRWQIDQLRKLELGGRVVGPEAIYERVLAALKMDKFPEPVPDWFLKRYRSPPYTYLIANHGVTGYLGRAVELLDTVLEGYERTLLDEDSQYLPGWNHYRWERVRRLRETIKTAIRNGCLIPVAYSILDSTLTELRGLLDPEQEGIIYELEQIIEALEESIESSRLESLGR